MNSSQPAPGPSPQESTTGTDSTLTETLRRYRRKMRMLILVAFAVGFLCVLTGVVIAWTNVLKVLPMERLLLQEYSKALTPMGTNGMDNTMPEKAASFTRAELEWRHVQVTAAHGKILFLISLSVALLGVGTFLTLLLVVFHRQVTTAQINANLAHISEQLRKPPDTKEPDAGK